MYRKNHTSVSTMLALVVLMTASLVHRAEAQNHRGVNQFPNIQLTTQDGNTVHFYDDLIKGKIVAINLIYTHCEYACPLETARLVQVQIASAPKAGTPSSAPRPVGPVPRMSRAKTGIIDL